MWFHATWFYCVIWTSDPQNHCLLRSLKRWKSWSKSIVLENMVVINFDFRSGAKKSGHLDFPLQSYGPNNTAYLGTKSETNIFKFRCILGPSAIKKGRLLAQPSYLSTLKPIKHFSGSFNFFPKVSRDTSQWAHCEFRLFRKSWRPRSWSVKPRQSRTNGRWGRRSWPRKLSSSLSAAPLRWDDDDQGWAISSQKDRSAARWNGYISL